MELAQIKKKPFIVGHSHVPIIVDNLLYDSGDWVNHNTYLIMENNEKPILNYYIYNKNYLKI